MQLEIYSPELVTAQEEFLLALRNKAALAKSDAFWEVLITALEQQGKSEEASQTKIRAAAQTG